MKGDKKMDVIGNIYQMYCDNVKEGGKTKLAGEAMEKEIRGLCSEETARKVEDIVLDYKTVSDAERFKEGFRCAALLMVQCVAGDLPVQEYFGKFLK